MSSRFFPSPVPSRPRSPRRFLLAALVTLAGLAGTASAPACSVCGCSLSSDWAAQGYASAPGLDATVRLEYFDQSDLRTGSGSVDHSRIVFPNDREIQQRTVNRNTWLDLNYGFNSSWAVSVAVPYHDRFHTTIAAGDTDVSTAQASGVGDARLLVRYQRTNFSRSFSFQAGLKLPTGGFDQDFARGPQAGELLDRGLQLGTGTTDLLAGAAWFTRPAVNVGLFAQVMLDQPLAARAGFLPSTSVTFSGGVRWLNLSRFTPQLQVNIKTEGREHGAEADTPNSGGTTAYLSPGVTTELAAHTTSFVFVQLPVYQRVNGLQLEPKWILSLGVRMKL